MRSARKLALVFTLLPGAVLADEKPTQQITQANQHVIQEAPAENFSGKAQFSRLPIMPSTGAVAPATVTFAPNTVTNWHIHPHGQYLIVIEGEGRTQEWKKPIQPIQKGDVIWCPPGVKHWHGASAHSGMTHIAITPVANDNQKVAWLEKVQLPPAPQTQQTIASSAPLTQKQLGLIPVAAFTATGDLERLKPALVSALEGGLTINEIKEALAHQYAYAGFPRSLNGLLTFKNLLEQREQLGIKDKAGAMPQQAASDVNYYRLGTDTLSYLTKTSAEKPLNDNFSPTIDYALKAHLFGYLFSRDNLSYIDRELVTIATLSALGNVNNQLASHFNVMRNLGLNESQLQQIITVLDKKVSASVANNSLAVLQQGQSTPTK